MSEKIPERDFGNDVIPDRQIDSPVVQTKQAHGTLTSMDLTNRARYALHYAVSKHFYQQRIKRTLNILKQYTSKAYSLFDNQWPLELIQ